MSDLGMVMIALHWGLLSTNHLPRLSPWSTTITYCCNETDDCWGHDLQYCPMVSPFQTSIWTKG